LIENNPVLIFSGGFDEIKTGVYSSIMDIRIRTNKLIYIIAIQGELEMSDSNQLKELIMKMVEKRVERFILDVGNVKSIDSSGIGALIYISSTLKKMDLALAIANVRGPVKAVMERTRLSSYFPIYDDVAQAIEKLS
jgi:anti-sigma B factor antagonist